MNWAPSGHIPYFDANAITPFHLHRSSPSIGIIHVRTDTVRVYVRCFCVPWDF